MRINSNLNFNKKNYSFCAGKTKLYTDFDGTYFPYPQDSIVYENTQNISEANKMYSGFKKFADLAKEKFSIVITTGRSRLEMLGMLRDFEKSKVDFYEPEGYIFRDGFEENNNIKNGSLVDNSSSRFLNEKEDIKQIIHTINNQITILEPLSNKRITGNSDRNLISLFKEQAPEKRKNYVSFVSETSGLIELSFPPNTDTQKYYEKISNYYYEKGIPVDIRVYNNDKNMYVPIQNDSTSEGYTFLPGNVILIKHKNDDEPIDKLYQPKRAVKEILQNQTNDLVIVAGDSSNDIKMLNPLNYIDTLDIYPDKNKSVDELLKDDKVLSAIDELPLIIILAGENKSIEPIRKMKDALDDKGIHKIFNAKYPDSDFLNKIKQGMLIYSEQNDDFKYNLSFELYEELME
ncbi:hypothetical protein IJ182_05855 [bacterium]|nr:hypothetical protein [bacterium]